MRNSWTHFWHKLYGNCYTFNKGINDVGVTTEVMNSSQAGLGNWLKFLQQTFILDFEVRYCISVLNSSEGRDRCKFWSLPNWISFIFLLNLSHGTRSYWGGATYNFVFLQYLIIIPRVCFGYEMVDGYNHLISNKREWNNCFIKNAQKIASSSRLYL